MFELLHKFSHLYIDLLVIIQMNIYLNLLLYRGGDTMQMEKLHFVDGMGNFINLDAFLIQG